LFIYFYNSQLGFAGGWDGDFTRTVNGGGNLWRPIAIIALSGHYQCSDSTYYFSTVNRLGYTYQWRFNNQPISTNAIDSAITQGSFANGTLTVIVSNGFVSDTASQTFYVSGRPEFTMRPLRAYYDSLCYNQNDWVIVDSSLSNVSYQLYKAGLPLGNSYPGNGGTIMLPCTAVTATTLYTVIATRNSNCTSYRDTATKLIIVATPANVPISAAPASICLGDTAKVQIQLSQPGTTYTLYRNFNNYATVSGNGSTVYLTYTGVGASTTFTVKANNYLGCTANLTPSISFIVDTMYTNFTRVEDVLVGEDIQLRNQSDGDNYLWTFDAAATVLTDTAYEPYPLSYSAPGERIVLLNATTAVAGCNDTVLKRVRVFEPMDTTAPGQVCAFDTIYTPSTKILAYHVDRFGNQYIAGYTTFLQGGISSSATYYYFLQKINKNGQVVWQKIQDYSMYSLSSYYGGYITGITTDPFGNVYVCGNFGALFLDFAGWGIIGSTSTQNYYIGKLDTAGVFQWITHSYTSGNSSRTGATDILYVDSNHIYVSVFGGGSVVIEPNDSIRYIVGGVIGGNFVMRINHNGYYQDKVNITDATGGGFGFYNPNNWMVITQWMIGISPKMHLRRDGKIVLVGQYGGNNGYIQFGTTPQLTGYGIYVALLNPSVGWESAYKISYTGNVYNDPDNRNALTRIHASCVDASGNLYIATPYLDTVWYGNGHNLTYSTEVSSVQRYSPSGQRQWSVKNNSSVRSLALSDNSDRLYMFGEYDRFIGFSSAMGDTIGRRGEGGRDAYIASLDSSGSFQWLQNIGSDSVDGAHIMVKDCGGALNCLGYTKGTVHVMNATVSTAAYKNFILRYDPAGNNCQQQICPAYVDDYRSVYDTITISHLDTTYQYVQLLDSITVLSNFYSLDTVHVFDTVSQLVNYHHIDTIHHNSVIQTFDSQLVIYYNHHVDSVVYYDSVITQLQFFYTDTMRIIRTIDTTHAVGQVEINNRWIIVVTPNPATDQLFIETNGIPITEINIYNTAGILVSKLRQLQSNTIDISPLAKGIYIVEAKTKEGSVRQRWVKM
ncbi:MAG: T9SS type A sorting domain-containing protein, partial [Bacteroidota bacterium]